MDGVLVIDKPEGLTSHDVVNRVRRLACTKRVGHLGTLDPIATGVLPLVLNRATRLARFFGSNEKVYEAVIRFGHSTDTYDRAGKPTSASISAALDRDQVLHALAGFEGKFTMVPPPVSAKKVAGVPAYKLARKNIEVELKPVEVEVFSLEVLSIASPDVTIRLRCSAGTYVRGIAHGVGQQIGCGAFLQSLRRTASGSFDLSRAYTLERLAGLAVEDGLAGAVIPGAQLLSEFPAEIVDTVTANFIRQGRDFQVSPFRVREPARFVKAISPEGDLIAIGEARLPHLYHPVLVL